MKCLIFSKQGTWEAGPTLKEYMAYAIGSFTPNGIVAASGLKKLEALKITEMDSSILQAEWKVLSATPPVSAHISCSLALSDKYTLFNIYN